jgi:hypothetical protein
MELDLVSLFLLVLLNGVIDTLLGIYIFARFAGKRSKEALVDFVNDDPEAQHMIARIVAMAIVTPVETGKKVTDEDGKEHEETLPLFKYVGRELSNALLYKLKAARGGSLSAAGKEAMDTVDSSGLLGSLGPRKGQSTQEWLMEQLMMRAMPAIEKKVNQMIETSVAGGGGQGF